jgi:hypothetical protein
VAQISLPVCICTDLSRLRQCADLRAERIPPETWRNQTEVTMTAEVLDRFAQVITTALEGV